MVNKERPHVFVLPEDDLNHELAYGFWLGLEFNKQGQMFVLPNARGWKRVLDIFESEHIFGMDRYHGRFMILLIDLDNNLARLNEAQSNIPDRLSERVFILSTLDEPEVLKANLGRSCEQIGIDMARDCGEGIDNTWSHAQLRHNVTELKRLREHVFPILF